MRNGLLLPGSDLEKVSMSNRFLEHNNGDVSLITWSQSSTLSSLWWTSHVFALSVQV